MLLLQTEEQDEHSRLAASVFSEQTIDMAGLQSHCDVVQDGIVAVAEFQIVDCYHSVLVQ